MPTRINSARQLQPEISAHLSVGRDYNGNGIVDAADYTVWRDHLGKTFSLSNRDGTNSGAINAADYTYWVNHFGQHAGAGVGAPAEQLLPSQARC